jgi:hypothetical protein
VASPEAEQLLLEYSSLKQWTSEVQSDGVIGGLYQFVQMDGYKIMFSQEFDGDHDVIRFFMAREAPRKDFAITYFWSRYIKQDRVVLRRFVGHEPSGWRNDTIDVETLEYLGRQGRRDLRLPEDEESILEQWGIELL